MPEMRYELVESDGVNCLVAVEVEPTPPDEPQPEETMEELRLRANGEQPT